MENIYFKNRSEKFPQSLLEKNKYSVILTYFETFRCV